MLDTPAHAVGAERDRAEIPGRARGRRRCTGNGSRRTVWSQPPERAHLAAALPARRDRRAGRPFAPGPWSSMADRRRGRGRDLRTAPRPSWVGSAAAGVRDGPPRLWPGDSLDGVSLPGPQRADRPAVPTAEPEGLPAGGTARAPAPGAARRNRPAPSS